MGSMRCMMAENKVSVIVAWYTLHGAPFHSSTVTSMVRPGPGN